MASNNAQDLDTGRVVAADPTHRCALLLFALVAVLIARIMGIYSRRLPGA